MAAYRTIGLQSRVVMYLRDARAPRTNEQIRQAVQNDKSNCINALMYRLYRQGIVDRVSKGEYRIAQQYLKTDEVGDQIIVESILDRLQQQYPQAFRNELRRRGWKR